MNSSDTGKHLPLVSILLPTYNRPYYFEMALLSALNQTYPNIEIIISDNSSNSETERVMQKYLGQHNNIVYIRKENGMWIDDDTYARAQGEYVNYLMDDDVFHFQKIERMVPYLIRDESTKLVTAHRQIIDSNSKAMSDNKATTRIVNQDTLISGEEICKLSILNSVNFIGEPTTVLYRKKDLQEPFGYFNNRQYCNNGDMATWYSLLTKGNAVFLYDTLSYFRIHEGNAHSSDASQINGVIDFLYSLYIAPYVLKNIDIHSFEYQRAVLHTTDLALPLIEKYKDNPDSIPEVSKPYFDDLMEYSIKLLDVVSDDMKKTLIHKLKK